MDLCLFAKECLKDLPKKAYNASESEADLAELYETPLKLGKRQVPVKLSSPTCLTRGLTDQRKTGPGDGPWPIPSVGGGARARNTDYPGTPHARRTMDALVGKEGITELCLFARDCLKDLPKKAHASHHSEADLAELHETRLKLGKR